MYIPGPILECLKCHWGIGVLVDKGELMQVTERKVAQSSSFRRSFGSGEEEEQEQVNLLSRQNKAIGAEKWGAVLICTGSIPVIIAIGLLPRAQAYI